MTLYARQRSDGHTPGPWHHGVGNSKLVWSGKKIESVVVAACDKDEDAHLIAAAPDMLAALQAFQDAFEQKELVFEAYEAAYAKTTAAIAKATE